jgi:predicted transcriptional regulator
MKSLTRAEEQVMKVLWQLGSGLLMEIVEAMPVPQPHKNTVATIHRYHPVLSWEAYSKDTLTHVAKGYFDGSFSNVVSFLVDEKKLSVKELELLLQQLKKNKK